MLLDQSSKNPARAAAGRRGAEARWGHGRILRLDQLTEAQKGVVIALVEAARAANRTVEAAAAGSNGDGHGAGSHVADSDGD